MKIEILRTGRFRDAGGRPVEITTDALRHIAEAYDPGAHEAPVVIGHPRDDAPAYGWVKRLEVQEDTLLAELDQLDPAFLELVRTGRYKQRSASLYLPGHPNHPRGGEGMYLRHIGFLGAQPPAVKGLRPVQLADDGEFIAELSLPARRPKENADMADHNAPDAMEARLKELEGRARELEARMRELAEKEAAILAREKELEAERRRMRHDTNVAFAEALVQQGRLTPAEVETVAVVLDVLDSLPADFADKAAQGTAERFRKWLRDLPAKVEFGERAPASTNGIDTADADEIARAALAYQRQLADQGVEIRIDEAVRRITEGKR